MNLLVKSTSISSRELNQKKLKITLIIVIIIIIIVHLRKNVYHIKNLYLRPEDWSFSSISLLDIRLSARQCWHVVQGTSRFELVHPERIRDHIFWWWARIRYRVDSLTYGDDFKHNKKLAIEQKTTILSLSQRNVKTKKLITIKYKITYQVMGSGENKSHATIRMKGVTFLYNAHRHN